MKSFTKLGKEVLVGIVLDCKDKFETPLTNINEELTDLRHKLTKLESGLAISKNLNNKLFRQLVNVKKKFWVKNQYSRRECLKISGILDTFSQNDLEKNISNIFQEWDAKIDSVNTEACHRLKLEIAGLNSLF